MKNTLENVHLSIYKYLKKKAQSLEGKPHASLLEYQKDQQISAKRKFAASSIHELTESIEESDIIYLGDFHTFDQSTRNLERLIRIFTSKRHDFAIALEFVNVTHQIYIDYFLAGHITELEFLESINYKESWRFPWTYYKKFFEIAKKENIPIIALNTQGSLKSRDHRAAITISKYYKRNPTSKIVVLFGEYHIIPNKLPKRVMDILKKEVIHTIIHQNLDDVYWKLSKELKIINDKVVKFSNREYVLITSTPWLKYESQIYWYEHLSEDPDFDIHEYIIENGALNFSENVPENFSFICEEINKSLGLNIAPKDIDDFHLYDHIKLDYITKEINKVKPIVLRNFYYELIKRGRSFKLPDSMKYFCPNYSINRISYLAGIHIYHICLNNIKFDYCSLFRSTDREKILFFMIKQSIIAYFSSKLINPYRKCDLYLDYKKLIRSKKTTANKKLIYTLALKITDKEINVKKEIVGMNRKDMYYLARALGHMYGDILFDNSYAKSMDFNDVFRFIFTTEFDYENFLELKDKILFNIEYKKLSKRVF